MSAFRSFFVGVRAGKWGREGDLWSLLAMLTIRKAARQARRHRAAHRSVERELEPPVGWESTSREFPSCDEAAILTEELEWLINATAGLDREILLLLLRGDELEEIATQLEISTRSVRRSLQRILELVSKDRTQKQIARDTMEPRPEGLPDIILGRQPTRTLSDITLHRMVGQGGLCKVFLGTDHPSGMKVAAKFLRKSKWTDTRAVRACLNELDVLSRLRNPNLGSSVGWGRTRSGALFLVMEWIEGENLRSWIGEPHSVEDVIQVGLDVATGLSVAHAAGITHCDLKPENVMRDRDGRFRLIDFGLAHWTGADETPQGGSVGYLAPEQISPAFGKISEQTDIYGLGALLYALLTGGPPWGNDYSMSLLGVLSSKPCPQLPDKFPAGLSQIISRAIAKSPTDRWTKIEAMRIALLRQTGKSM